MDNSTLLLFMLQTEVRNVGFDPDQEGFSLRFRAEPAPIIPRTRKLKVEVGSDTACGYKN